MAEFLKSFRDNILTRNRSNKEPFGIRKQMSSIGISQKRFDQKWDPESSPSLQIKFSSNYKEFHHIS